jgi:hypothetical protein
MSFDVLYLYLPSQLDLLSQVLQELALRLLDLRHVHHIAAWRDLLLATQILVVVWILIV